MDIQSTLLYLTLSVLFSWIAHTRVRHQFIVSIIDGVALIFLFLTARSLYPGFLSDGTDELSMKDFAIMTAVIVVWIVVFKRLFKRTETGAQ